MKCQVLFSVKNNKNITNFLSDDLAYRVQKLKMNKRWITSILNFFFVFHNH